MPPPLENLVERIERRGSARSSAKAADAVSGASAPIGHAGHRSRLRARVLAGGLEAMPPYELLELLLAYALPRGDTKALAKGLLAGRSLGGLLSLPPRELAGYGGLGEHSASLLALVARIHRELAEERAAAEETCLDPAALVPWFRAAIGLSEQERFAAVFLDQGRRILAREVFERGSRTRTVLYPRRLFEAALRHGATAFVLAHNHPGGTCVPSAQDRELTRRLAAQADGLEIALLDHLIVTRSAHLSFREAGYL